MPLMKALPDSENTRYPAPSKTKLSPGALEEVIFVLALAAHILELE